MAQDIVVLYAHTLSLQRVSCEDLISRGPELAEHLGYLPHGIQRDSIAARGMSHEARASGGGVPSVEEGGVSASLQSIGARGSITPKAQRAIYLALKRMGLLRDNEYLVDNGYDNQLVVVKMPYYFSSNGTPSLQNNYRVGGYNFRMAEMMLNDSILRHCKKHETRCDLTRRSWFEVLSFERIENRKIFERHKCYEARVAETMARQGKKFNYMTNQSSWLKKLAKKNELCQAANTVYLLHGTKESHIDHIVLHGLKTKFSLQQDYELSYGKGLYFTDNACKASQYMGNDGLILVCRVVLGQQECLKGPTYDRLFPRRKYNSAMAQKGITVARSGRPQLHNEFIVYDESACYPEFVISIRKN